MARLIFGTGDYTYEVIQPFGRLPADMDFGITHRVAVDSKNKVYVTQQQDPPVLVFNSDGNYLMGWGEGLLSDPHGIYITPSNEVFVVDRDAHEVVKFTPEGKVLLRLGSRGKAHMQAPFNHPADVAVSPSGDIFVADGYGNSCVHKFSSKGQLIFSWGTPGSGPGEFWIPHGIWVNRQNTVYVADRENSRVQIFDSEGNYKGEWHDLYHPMDIWMDGDGMIYVTDETPRFTVLSPEGKVLSRGKAPDAGLGLYGDSRGNLYLTGVFPGALSTFRGIVRLVRQ